MVNTTDPALRSFIEVAPDSHFPIQNLPYCAFYTTDKNQPRIGVAIGDFILDLNEIEKEGLFDGEFCKGTNVFGQSTLNKFMELGKEAWTEARETISNLLFKTVPTLRDNQDLRKRSLIPSIECTFMLPFQVSEF
ncbi:MAG: fumarylacetoacetase, partial [Candidatus Kariarchaeaceae archaeon]